MHIALLALAGLIIGGVLSEKYFLASEAEQTQAISALLETFDVVLIPIAAIMVLVFFNWFRDTKTGKKLLGLDE
ncbi:hypothetical protein [Vibrio rotiferianus]|jgi:hypothetical protein|uniref:hypothetical protein n=1 Tax=Vibrio rotiferianus TaxID=190895 RepID=UPI0005EF82FE|nr:hypothetical protein [Vibrio rotiferianus]